MFILLCVVEVVAFILFYLICAFPILIINSILLVNVLSNKTCIVDLPGGPLEIEWREEDNHVYMTGPAEAVFYGSVPL